MSIFQINTNSAAMNALYNLNNTGDSLAQSIQRLSTGLQINSAADNPAGLVIAKQFQAQITGIQQAISNNQDAINYTKTADGALGEINNLLNTARGLAVAASNSGVISSSEAQADQSQLSSIVSSITRIAQNTQFGTKYLLNGSAGVTSALTNATDVSAINIGGTFAGQALSTNSAVTMQVTTAATQASVTLSSTFAGAASTVSAGQFTINGTTFNTTSSMTVSDVVNIVNQASAQTGVEASFVAGSGVKLTATQFGSVGNFSMSDANNVLQSGSVSATGVNAVATVQVGALSATFTGGEGTNNGFTLTDANGNQIVLSQAGNATTALTGIGQINVGTAQFQIGGNVGQTADLSLANFSSNQLGTGAVAGLNLGNIDLSSFSSSQQALQVIDSAISQVTTSRGAVGSFQSDVLQANMDTLNIASQNLTASLSNIQDTNIAAEMTNFTQLQILQQAGVGILAQANAAPQAVLKLIP